MPQAFSSYLDLVRFLAAITVVISHFTFPQFTAGVSYQGALAGIAVTVFFVLSGYVISYAADKKEPTLRHFAVSRLARIYSVAIPALILTILIDLYMIHQGLGHQVPIYEYQGLWKYLPIFLTFTSEIGPFHIHVLTDGPFWSLSYEVWYYVAFALLIYLRGLWRVVLGALVLAFLGLPALVYLPIWLSGSLVYKLNQHLDIDCKIAFLGATSTLIVAFGLWYTGFCDLADDFVNTALRGWPAAHLHNSVHFPSQYVIGVLAALHFLFVRHCDLHVFTAVSFRRVVTYLASFTFAIYLAHRPLMNLWAYLIDHNPNSPDSIAVLFFMVLASAWFFGLLSEHRKEWWRTVFRSLLRVPQIRDTRRMERDVTDFVEPTRGRILHGNVCDRQ
jgi:peptidoglycan/LPS O-acetylase OafA/YrhL